ncbi:TPA_asm: P0 protein [Foeniculum vulgare polerovirus]|nr:TPA_asm: P0 protein [Foeniculum vulgare polerovirus]
MLLSVNASGLVSLPRLFDKSATLLTLLQNLYFTTIIAYNTVRNVDRSTFLRNFSTSAVHIVLHLLHPGFTAARCGFTAALTELQPYIRRSMVLGFLPELSVRTSKFSIRYRRSPSTKDHYRNIYQDSMVRDFSARVGSQQESFVRGLCDFNQLLGVFLQHVGNEGQRLDNIVPGHIDPQLVLSLLDGHKDHISACHRLHNPVPSIRIPVFVSLLNLEGDAMGLPVVSGESGILADVDDLQADQAFANELYELLNNAD